VNRQSQVLTRRVVCELDHILNRAKRTFFERTRACRLRTILIIPDFCDKSHNVRFVRILDLILSEISAKLTE